MINQLLFGSIQLYLFEFVSSFIFLDVKKQLLDYDCNVQCFLLFRLSEISLRNQENRVQRKYYMINELHEGLRQYDTLPMPANKAISVLVIQN